MKLASVRIKNFRAFEDVTVPLGNYTCLVGPNGAGKSTVIAALNIFFRHSKTASTDVLLLEEEDFHRRNTASPVEIILTFENLTPEAQASFRDYYRHGKLIVCAKAEWDEGRQIAPVSQHGIRLGMEKFGKYFELDAGGAKAQELKGEYARLKQAVADLPKATSKEEMADALRKYESAHSEECSEIPSTNQFYGFTKGANRLAAYVQWVHVPAIKDATEEDAEGKETWLGQLLARAVRSKVAFDSQLSAIRKGAQELYDTMMEQQQGVLAELSKALSTRMADWSTPDSGLLLKWVTNEESAIKIAEPFARVLACDGCFQGSLVRHGCGFQRSYLLALLQELAVGGSEGPALLLGCEEPELFQHPPQARYLASVFEKLSRENTQVVVCTHSPLFVSGRTFEDIRLFRRSTNSACGMQRATFDEVALALKNAGAPELRTLCGTKVKLHQELQPRTSEMFFSPVLVLVEGIEDVAYITAYLELMGHLDEYRRLGCHIIPADCKSRIPLLLAIARKLAIPTFVVFDSDGAETKADRRKLHERDNLAILRLAGYPNAKAMPAADQWFPSVVQWSNKLQDAVVGEVGVDAFADAQQTVRTREGLNGEAGLEKKSLFIGLTLDELHAKGARSASLERLCDSLIAFATSSRARTTPA